MRVRIEEVDPRRVELLQKNARHMRHETFSRLAKNVEGDGTLTSVPFCIRSTIQNKDWLVISGNHRVKAAIVANLERIHIMVTDDELTPGQIKAIQIAHNSLVGEDDPIVLKEIYESIEEPVLKEYTGLDDKVLGLLGSVNVEPTAAAQLEWTSISFLFLPDELDRLKVALEKCGKAAKAVRFAARFSDYDRFMDAISLVSESYRISNVATAMMLLIDVFDRHPEELTEGFVDKDFNPGRLGVVPAVAALGTSHVPVTTAALIQKICDHKGDDRFGPLKAAISAYLAKAAASG